MKKTSRVCCAILCFFLLTACSSNDKTKQPSNATKVKEQTTLSNETKELFTYLDATLKAKNGENVKIYHCENLKEAVELSKNISTPGDVVLLSPASASFDAFKNFVERGIKFKELVNNLK